MNSASSRSTRVIRLKICKPSFDNIFQNTCRAPRRSRARTPAMLARRRARNSRWQTLRDPVRKAIAFGVESMTLNQAAAESGEPEPLHQLRVASRRLRASIELFSGVIYAGQLK